MTAESAAGDVGFSAAHGPISSLIPVLAREHRATAASLLRGLGIAPGQELMLMMLWHRQPRPQTELARELAVEPPTAAKMLARMQRAGLVSRTRSPDDRRVVLVELTERGRCLQEPVEAVWRELEQRTVASLTQQQQHTLAELLRTVIDGLADHTADDPARREDGAVSRE